MDPGSAHASGLRVERGQWRTTAPNPIPGHSDVARWSATVYISRSAASREGRSYLPSVRLVLCGDVCLAVPLKTGVNLNLAICGTDVLLCPQLRSWGCRPRAIGSSGATVIPDLSPLVNAIVSFSGLGPSSARFCYIPDGARRRSRLARVDTARAGKREFQPDAVQAPCGSFCGVERVGAD